MVVRNVMGRLLLRATQAAFRQWKTWAHVTGVRANLAQAREEALEDLQRAHAVAARETMVRNVMGRLLLRTTQAAFRRWKTWAHVSSVREALAQAREEALEDLNRAHETAAREAMVRRVLGMQGSTAAAFVNFWSWCRANDGCMSEHGVERSPYNRHHGARHQMGPLSSSAGVVALETSALMPAISPPTIVLINFSFL